MLFCIIFCSGPFNAISSGRRKKLHCKFFISAVWSPLQRRAGTVLPAGLCSHNDLLKDVTNELCSQLP